MIRRTFAIPARYAPALDAAIDRLVKQIEADTIPVWGQDPAPAHHWLTIQIEHVSTPHAHQRTA